MGGNWPEGLKDCSLGLDSVLRMSLAGMAPVLYPEQFLSPLCP